MSFDKNIKNTFGGLGLAIANSKFKSSIALRAFKSSTLNLEP